MFLKVASEDELIPFFMQLNAIHREADTRKIFPDDDLEQAKRLIVDEVDVLTAGRDQTNDIAKVDGPSGDQPDVEAEIKSFFEA